MAEEEYITFFQAVGFVFNFLDKYSPLLESA